MPELRHDPIAERDVVVAAERAARPHTFRAMDPISAAAPDNCPFCPGHETETPPEVARTGSGAPDTPGWRIRVFPNKFPIVARDAATPTPSDDPWRQAQAATGTHEVATMSPAHHRTLADLDDVEAIELFSVLAERTRVHRDLGHRYTQVLINHGKAAGASIEHPHAQMIAVDFIPTPIDALADRNVKAGSPLVATARDHEGGGELALPAAAGAVAWCPWAAGSPFAMMITPSADEARFADADAASVAAVAVTARDAVRALRAAAGEQPYNLLVISAAEGDDRPFQWYVEIQPRLSVIAGFELGAGVYVNIVPPEQAATLLGAHMGEPN